MPEKISINSSSNNLSLHGFNNLTKNLAISIYKIYYANNKSSQLNQLSSINAYFSPEKLNQILTDACHLIGANVLNTSQQAYEPQGASVTMMIADGEPLSTSKHQTHINELVNTDNNEYSDLSLVAHLDKSHLCVHTYPESHPNNNISTIRIDFELSTCGVISPLHAANYLVTQLNADLVSLDYRIRGFTRDKFGSKHYLDHAFASIQDYLPSNITNKYCMRDLNNIAARLYFTQLRKQNILIEEHMIKDELDVLTAEEKITIEHKIITEINDIYLTQ